MLILDKRDADFRVSLVLIRHGKPVNLKGLEMILYKNDEGQILEIMESQVVERETLVSNVDRATQLLANAQAVLAEFDAFTAEGSSQQTPPEDAAVEEPATTPEAQPEAPTVPEAPVTEPAVEAAPVAVDVPPAPEVVEPSVASEAPTQPDTIVMG